MLKTVTQGFTAALLAFALVAVAPSYGQTARSPGPWMGGRMDTNLYLGANVGQSRFRTSCDDVPASCDDKDVGWRFFAGYQFHRNFAVEGGYFQLGEATASGGGISAEAKVRGLELLGVAIFPVMDQLSLFAKAGVARSRVSVSGSGFGVAASAKDNSTDFTFGLGAQYLFTRNFGARLEWQRYDAVGGDNTGKDDLDLFSLGVLYRF
jgi:OOP family OmpA-OmpF porin